MSSQQLTVAVLGAGGTIAPAIVADLAQSDEVAKMALLDIDAERAGAVAEQHGGEKASAGAVDARDVDGLARAIESADVLLNTASYRINLEAMRAALKAGCHYLDLGGLYWMTARQRELDTEFRDAGLLALLGIGSSPGKTNLMAARGVSELGEGVQIESVDVFAAGRDPVPAGEGKLRPPYALQTLLDELRLPPVILRDGKPTEIEPLADGGEVDYGDPIGTAQTIYTLHSELSTFGESFGCRRCSFRLSLAPALLTRLRELAAGSEDEVAAASKQVVPPSGETVSIHMVRVEGTGGEAVTVRAVTRPHFGLGGSIVSTATPIAAAARLLARGSLSARGALPPEACIDPVEMFAELGARGCEFSGERS